MSIVLVMAALYQTTSKVGPLYPMPDSMTQQCWLGNRVGQDPRKFEKPLIF